MGLKLAKTAGCKVIITSSSDDKLRTVKALSGIGPILSINYVKFPVWDVEAVKLNDGIGLDIVIENVGTSSLSRSINAVAKRGIISQVAYLRKQNLRDLEGLLSKLIDKAVVLRYDFKAESGDKADHEGV